ncbi:hypothetical protein CGZ80_10115 [Rhodopirellula sp. MGV]|nr:hypothetical protein CGZ80_10115 [Rhodopirellula sp. MGV]PNY36552.1 hypothetical protein C2E31_11890 [Rhodopirellula baltica]
MDQTGAFQASYFGIGDGAPVGEYKVLVFMLETPPGGGLPVDRFQGRYLNEDHPVATLTVRPGENDCGTIELGKK